MQQILFLLLPISGADVDMAMSEEWPKDIIVLHQRPVVVFYSCCSSPLDFVERFQTTTALFPLLLLYIFRDGQGDCIFSLQR